MKDGKIDLETSLVARELRDKIIRVNPLKLTHKIQIMDEETEYYISVIQEAAIAVGVLTPVLLDASDSVISGENFVHAAIQLGVDTIPAINFEALNACERLSCLETMRHYFEIADLDQENFLIETQNILPFILDECIALDNLSNFCKTAQAR